MAGDMQIEWRNAQDLPSRRYICGHCDAPLASNVGYRGAVTVRDGRHCRNGGMMCVYICHYCSRPTYFDLNGTQSPGVCHGNAVSGIDDTTVRDLYDEARRATSANCSTAAVLCCRKLLMHVAVAKGAEENKTFKQYVEYLGEHFVPKPTIEWVNHIKDKGNEANHEIVLMESEDAKDLLAFVEMLLKLIYEFPAAMRQKQTPPVTQ